MNVPSKIKEKLRALPDSPGCYLMRDARGKIVYVGKAASLRKRVQSYFRSASLRSGSPKLRSMVHSVADLEWLVTRTEAEAILTEGRLIKDYRPRYNVSFRDDKRFLLLRVDPREPVPRLRLCRIRREDGARYFGPYASSAAARTALDFVEKRYGLRQCETRIPIPQDYRRCIADVVRYCSAPCVGKETPGGYAERVESACAFLRGERPAELEAMRQIMKEAAAGRDYERAAAIRDTYLLLRAAVQQRVRAVRTPAMRHEDARAGAAELAQCLGLPSPPRTIEAYDISTISGTHAVGSMVCALDGAPQRQHYRRFRIRTVSGSDDPAMMREVLTRRFARLRESSAPSPDLVLVDGGITQVRAARDGLASLGFDSVPVAGLAKRFEEIFRGDTESVVRLPRDSRALQVLQALRDEAHRFALTYHRRLRESRLRESVLDAVEGVGGKRKQALLARFGSVHRLREAGEAEIAATPGVGLALARRICQALGRNSGCAAGGGDD